MKNTDPTLCEPESQKVAISVGILSKITTREKGNEHVLQLSGQGQLFDIIVTTAQLRRAAITGVLTLIGEHGPDHILLTPGVQHMLGSYSTTLRPKPRKRAQYDNSP